MRFCVSCGAEEPRAAGTASAGWTGRRIWSAHGGQYVSWSTGPPHMRGSASSALTLVRHLASIRLGRRADLVRDRENDRAAMDVRATAVRRGEVREVMAEMRRMRTCRFEVY